MTLPRKQLVAVEDTPYYHVVSRCGRRSYLCGIDAYSGKDYEHRKGLKDRHSLIDNIPLPTQHYDRLLFPAYGMTECDLSLHKRVV
jgi:hypothetical protein